MTATSDTQKYERLSATPDPHHQRVFVAWGAGPVSGTLDLTADEAIAIGDAGRALKAANPGEHHADDPAPPQGSYWTGPDGKVWDLSCQYLDRHHRLWRVAEIGLLPMMVCIVIPGVQFPLPSVATKLGPLTPIPPPVITHNGPGFVGELITHEGARENCSSPECADAVADQREEQDEEIRRVRILLNSVGRFIEGWGEADEQGRTDLWRGLSAAADPVADLFEARIADLDHRAAQLPDGGLETKP